MDYQIYLELKTAKSILKETSDSFYHKTNRFTMEFLFVIEHKKRIIGLSGIKSRVGIKRPYYHFYYMKILNTHT